MPVHGLWLDAEGEREEDIQRKRFSFTALPEEAVLALRDCSLDGWQFVPDAALSSMHGLKRQNVEAWVHHADRLRANEALRVFHAALDVFEFLNAEGAR